MTKFYVTSIEDNSICQYNLLKNYSAEITYRLGREDVVCFNKTLHLPQVRSFRV